MSGPILVTGAAGYIGSHACLALLDAGHEVLALDNYCNSKPAALERVQELTGRSLRFFEIDLLEREKLQKLFARYSPASVIHFAGLKAVGESIAVPLRYWHNNVSGSTILLEVMARAEVRDLVFSSSATVYGSPASLPIREDAPLASSNPYGQTKLAIEHLLRDLYSSDPRWNISLLRYFNPVGAHPSGRIGEDPLGIPNNLMPFITQVAVGERTHLSVFGDDYDTPDGTCIRDYIHVLDLVDGHLKALEWLTHNPGLAAHNLGTGKGYSVLEVIRAFEAATGTEIPYEIADRRPGDLAATWADPSKAKRDLGWVATRTIESMCADAWNWQQNNPTGYQAD
ncbi:MAG TPA: UDP-glucose 4-epimerase GalE [Xanthomonadales bacterium]|nr:UDP-glucose 4-epimerase GalE [Xanthomonadales bacterium]